MKTAAKKITLFFWLTIAAFQLLFAAQLAPAKSAFVHRQEVTPWWNQLCAAPRSFVGTGQVQRRIISWELACGVRRNLDKGGTPFSFEGLNRWGSE
jgi:hypothetical protein